MQNCDLNSHSIGLSRKQQLGIYSNIEYQSQRYQPSINYLNLQNLQQLKNHISQLQSVLTYQYRKVSYTKSKLDDSANHSNDKSTYSLQDDKQNIINFPQQSMKSSDYFIMNDKHIVRVQKIFLERIKNTMKTCFFVQQLNLSIPLLKLYQNIFVIIIYIFCIFLYSKFLCKNSSKKTKKENHSQSERINKSILKNNNNTKCATHKLQQKELKELLDHKKQTQLIRKQFATDILQECLRQSLSDKILFLEELKKQKQQKIKQDYKYQKQQIELDCQNQIQKQVQNFKKYYRFNSIKIDKEILFSVKCIFLIMQFNYISQINYLFQFKVYIKNEIFFLIICIIVQLNYNTLLQILFNFTYYNLFMFFAYTFLILSQQNQIFEITINQTSSQSPQKSQNSPYLTQGIVESVNKLKKEYYEKTHKAIKVRFQNADRQKFKTEYD